jgi:hypothetical protein
VAVVALPSRKRIQETEYRRQEIRRRNSVLTFCLPYSVSFLPLYLLWKRNGAVGQKPGVRSREREVTGVEELQ